MANYRDEWFSNNNSNNGWYTCINCGKKLRKGDVDIDHILPKSLGGGDSLDNLQCLCKTCNRSKRNSTNDMIDDYIDNAARNYTKNVANDRTGLFNSIIKKLK